MLKRTLITVFVYLLSNSIFSQECFEYYKSACVPKNSKFIYTENISSVSFLFSSGESREIPFNLINGIDYRITLCCEDEFENVIQFKILTLDGKEMYNNSNQNFNLNLEFACRKTRDVVFVLQAPNPIIEGSDTVLVEGCIGVLVEEMVSVKTGF